MTEYELDAIDREILYALQEDARNLSSGEIADRTEASSSTVRKRIQRLESEGIIKGYSADVDYQKSGSTPNAPVLYSSDSGARGAHRGDPRHLGGRDGSGTRHR